MPKLKSDNLLYLVTDSTLCGNKSLEEVVEKAILGGVNIVQLREKDISQDDFLRIGRPIKNICSSYKIPFIVNDNIEVASTLDADGVHLGQTDLDYSSARKILGSEKIIGLSVNNLDQARQAENLDVDYLGVGPIFPTKTKLDVGKSWRLDDLKELRRNSRHKLIGIGGINHSNAKDVMVLGFDGLAVVSAICGAKCPKDSAKELCGVIVSPSSSCLTGGSRS